jgi:hypothetical protein
MRIIFKSLAHPNEYAYVYASYGSWRHNSYAMSPCFGMYQTYGDGMTAHSPDFGVTVEHYADYMASLAATATAAASDMISNISFSFTSRVDAGTIEFCKNLRRDEKKDTWYTLDESKYSRKAHEHLSCHISTSRAKDHDKRWNRVESWMDGSYEAIFQLLCKEHYSLHEKYVLARAISEHLGSYANSAEKLLNFPKVFGSTEPYAWALEACQAAIKSYRLREVADGQVRNYTRRMEQHQSLPTAVTEVAS